MQEGEGYSGSTAGGTNSGAPLGASCSGVGRGCLAARTVLRAVLRAGLGDFFALADFFAGALLVLAALVDFFVVFAFFAFFAGAFLAFRFAFFAIASLPWKIQAAAYQAWLACAIMVRPRRNTA
jgi:hypothetical protein